MRVRPHCWLQTMRPASRQQAPGLAALEARRLRIDDGHQRDARREVRAAAPAPTQRRRAQAAAPGCAGRPSCRGCCAQRSRSARQHRRRVGAHAAPEPERLGRLLDEHAQPVARRGAMRRGPRRRKAARGAAVHHVERQPAVAEHDRCDRQRPPRSGCSPVALTTMSKPLPQSASAAAASATPSAAPARRGAARGLGARRRAVDDGERRRPGAQQRPQRTRRRAAGADEQHARARRSRSRHGARCRAPGRRRRCCRHASRRRRSAACWPCRRARRDPCGARTARRPRP